ncbi:MAG: DinB family protein, partial [Chloroflexi bacterium]|nr:DinB family protein [Chloroflexota bacterium]
MDREFFLTLFDYGYWARDRLLQGAAKVTDEEFTKPLSKGYGSLRATLVHTIGAEWLWLARWQGEPLKNPPREEELSTLALIRERWQNEEANLRAFLAKMTDGDLSRDIEYRNQRGETFARPLWHSMTQVIHHGTQHRAEVAAMLTDFGHSPGNLDFLVYVDD